MDIFQKVVEGSEVRVAAEVSGQHGHGTVGSKTAAGGRKVGRGGRPAAAPVERAVEELGRTYLVKPVMLETAAAAAAAAAAGQVVTVRGVLKGVVVVVVDVLSCSRGGNVNGECTNEKEQKWCGV